VSKLSVQEVVACPQLPSLPAIASQVLELTRRPDIPMREIAEVVRNDQALASKILKTVNSSFYGLSTPCPSIDRAMSYLGLNTVKSLVLGFSFIDALGGSNAEDIDPTGAFCLMAHWRRAIYGAASARLVAKQSGAVDPDEAFLAALMQDVGMLAIFVARPDEYSEAIAAAERDNERVCDAEFDSFGFTHLEVGAELTSKWRLPDSIVQTVRHHHDPADAPSEHARFVRCGGLASLMASAAAHEACERDITVFFQRARAWFGFDRPAAERLLSHAIDGAAELSSLFQVNTGRKPNLSQLLSAASEALVEHQITTQRHTEDLQRQAYTDGLTGIANRKHFDELLSDSFRVASDLDGSLTVLFCDADKFKPFNDTHGHQAGDAVLVELARRLSSAVGNAGTVCRYGGEEFAAVLPGVNATEAGRIAELCRRAIEATPFDVRDVQCVAEELPVTISVGIATREADTGSFVRSAELLLRAADKAVYAAKEAGRNCVRLISLKPRPPKSDVPAHPAAEPPQTPTSMPDPNRLPIPPQCIKSIPIPVQAPAPPLSPRPADLPAPPVEFTILLVEDDPLQRKLISMPLIKHSEYTVEIADDGQSAIAAIGACDAQPYTDRYGLILLDVGLPDMSGVEVVRQIRQSRGHCTVPIVMLSAHEDEQIIRECLLAGANAYISKQSIWDDPKTHILKIVEFWATTCHAA